MRVAHSLPLSLHHKDGNCLVLPQDCKASQDAGHCASFQSRSAVISDPCLVLQLKPHHGTPDPVRGSTPSDLGGTGQ